MTGVKDYTESGKIKRVSYEEISQWILEIWQAVMVTCVKNGFQKAFGDTSMPEIEDHEESTSDNELSDVPEAITRVDTKVSRLVPPSAQQLC
jgi:hypothetical protein